MEQKICQSCGMPLTDEVLGTNADGSKNEEYCIYCFKDGAFTKDCTMDEMIEFCSQFVDIVNKNMPQPMTKEQYEGIMHQYFPMLKRWKQWKNRSPFVVWTAKCVTPILPKQRPCVSQHPAWNCRDAMFASPPSQCLASPPSPIAFFSPFSPFPGKNPPNTHSHSKKIPIFAPVLTRAVRLASDRKRPTPGVAFIGVHNLAGWERESRGWRQVQGRRMESVPYYVA